MHPNGINVGFCDGSVRYLFTDIPQSNWKYIQSRDDQQDIPAGSGFAN